MHHAEVVQQVQGLQYTSHGQCAAQGLPADGSSTKQPGPESSQLFDMLQDLRLCKLSAGLHIIATRRGMAHRPMQTGTDCMNTAAHALAHTAVLETRRTICWTWHPLVCPAMRRQLLQRWTAQPAALAWQHGLVTEVSKAVRPQLTRCTILEEHLMRVCRQLIGQALTQCLLAGGRRSISKQQQ